MTLQDKLALGFMGYLEASTNKAGAFSCDGLAEFAIKLIDRERTPYIRRLEETIRCLIENDPNADAADGVSVLDVWRKDARELLEQGK